jgi:hypothetical protein
MGGRKVDMRSPLCDFSGLHELYGPRVVWVHLDSLVGCIINSNCHDLGHDLIFGYFFPANGEE